MGAILPALLIIVLVAVVASIGRDGLWSNTIVFFNVLVAALVATNFFEPLAEWLKSRAGDFNILFDLLSLWVLFAGVLFALRAATDAVSRVKVRFVPPLDRFGGFAVAVLCGWILVCFVMMTLHTAPLARDFLFGGFRPEERMLFGTAPDRVWLGFMQRLSLGPLARSAPEGQPEAYAFDPRGDFMPKYATRRDEYSKTDTFTGKKSGAQ